MSKITFHHKWTIDYRAKNLGALLGNPREAEHVALTAWQLAMDYWEKGELIPGDEFLSIYGAFQLIQARLARVHTENNIKSPVIRFLGRYIEMKKEAENKGSPERDSNEMLTELNAIEQGFVYMHGSAEHLSWGVRFRRQRVEAGKKSAQKRLLNLGTSQPGKSKTKPKMASPPNGTRTEFNGLELTSTRTSTRTNTNTNTKKKNKYMGDFENRPSALFDFESVFAVYPKRFGSIRKGEGMKRIQKKIKTQGDFEKFKQAVVNYAKYISIEGTEHTKYVCQFETFCGDVWQEFIDFDTSAGNAKLSVTGKNNSTLQRLLEKRRAEQQQLEAPTKHTEPTEQFQLTQQGEQEHEEFIESETR